MAPARIQKDAEGWVIPSSLAGWKPGGGGAPTKTWSSYLRRTVAILHQVATGASGRLPPVDPANMRALTLMYRHFYESLSLERLKAFPTPVAVAFGVDMENLSIIEATKLKDTLDPLDPAKAIPSARWDSFKESRSILTRYAISSEALYRLLVVVTK